LKNKDIVLKRIEKAEERLEVARLLYNQKCYDDSISRSYYSIFFATKALLLTKDIDPRTHSAVRNQFAQHFVKTKEIEPEFNDILKEAKEIRERGDYSEFYSASCEEAKLQLENAEKFLQRVKKVLQEKGFL
jgi:uncharacterized protein (UPF0332 family)